MDQSLMPQEEDLDALFERIAARRDSAVASPPVDTAALARAPQPPRDEAAVFERIGALTRTLHDALRELGHDKTVETAVQALPDARERLAYIANLTGKAAERALGAVEQGKAAQEGNAQAAARLAADWERLYAGALDVEAFKALAGATRAFLGTQPAHAARMDACLHEVMMAQDFHDLTGQVIQRLAKLAQTLEDQLVTLLLDARPIERRPDATGEWLGGPRMDRSRADAVGDQVEVDRLLESLGF